MMPKKSRIIINNWTTLSDEMAVFYAHLAFKVDADYRTIKRFGKPDLGISKFHNKSSISLDVRELKGGNDSGS